jgi:hypothetical protein
MDPEDACCDIDGPGKEQQQGPFGCVLWWLFCFVVLHACVAFFGVGEEARADAFCSISLKLRVFQKYLCRINTEVYYEGVRLANSYVKWNLWFEQFPCL